MASLLAAALFFVGIHFVISGTALRGKIVGLIGEGPFRGVFSLMSLIGIVWLSRAYGQTEYVELWGRPYALRPFALITMLVAFFFVALAFTSPNPTAVGGGDLLAEGEPPKGIQRITRHPFLWASLFGPVLYSSDFKRRSRLCGFLWQFSDTGDRRTFFDRSKAREGFRRCVESLAALTSNVPFMAIIQGRNSLKIGEIGWWRVVLALILYGLFLHFHKTLFGVSPLPAWAQQ
jgi:uncharacterized membrane protein